MNDKFPSTLGDFKARIVLATLLGLTTIATMPAGATTTLIVDPAGNLLGATSVDVSGSLYDVTFVDGIGSEIFGLGFANGDGLPFPSEVEADAASGALAAQVFLNVPQGDFDDVPSLINGCEHAGACLVFTPYGASSARYVRVIDGDETFSGAFLGNSNNDDFTAFGYGESRTWAVWCTAGSGCAPTVGGPADVTIGALTYDSVADPDIISDSLNGYEWLRWNILDDLTLAQTQEALTTGAYSGQGWAIAGNTEALAFVDAVFDGPSHPCTTSGNYGTCGDPDGNFPALVGGNCGLFPNETLAWFLSSNGTGDEAGVIDHYGNTNNLLFYNERTSIAMADTWICPIPWLVYRDTGPAPGAENGIVGSWYNISDPDPVAGLAGGPVVLQLLDNGQFQFGEDGDSVADPNGMDGLEWGAYTFDGATLAFTGLLDTNGGWGVGSNSLSVTLDGNTLTVDTGDGDFVFDRIDSESLVGGWLAVGPVDDETVSITFLDDGTFMLIHGNNPGDTCGCGQAGIEYGTYTWNGVTNDISFTIQTDTNGEFGASHPFGGAWDSLVLTGDQFVISDGEDATTFLRILAADDDGDGVNNRDDNCTAAANADQLDSDGDNLGNACDADVNGDCSVNFGDLAALKAAFFPNPYDEDSDFNGDGFVNFGDLAYMKSTFFNSPSPGPGPSGLTNACE